MEEAVVFDMKRLKQMQKQPPVKEIFRIHPHDEFVLAALARYHYLTIKQIMALRGKQEGSYHGTTAKLARLLQKKDQPKEYLVQLQRFDSTTGKKLEVVYCLGIDGYDWLKRAGIPTRKPRKKADEFALGDVHIRRLILHSECLIAVEILARRDATITVSGIYHDILLAEQPIALTVDGKQRKVTPDGMAHVWHGEQEYCFFVEVQHVGHYVIKDIQLKVRNYLAIHEQEADKKRFGLGDDCKMRVLFVAAQGPAEAHKIKEAIEVALKDAFSHDEARTMAGLFAVAPLPDDTTTLYEQPIWTRPFRQDRAPLLEVIR